MVPNRSKTCYSLAEFENYIKSWIPRFPCRLCKLYVKGVWFVKRLNKQNLARPDDQLRLAEMKVTALIFITICLS